MQIYFGKSLASAAILRKVSNQVGASNLCFDAANVLSRRTYSNLVGLCMLIDLHMQLSVCCNTSPSHLLGFLMMTQLLNANTI